MDRVHDFDDAAAEALIAGAGADVDPQLAETIGDMRAVYSSFPPGVGSALAAWIGVSAPAVPFAARRFARMRSSMVAKVGAAMAAVVAATGGLAAAGALPAPMQDAVSHIGVGRPAHDSRDKHNGKTKSDDNQHTKKTTPYGSSTSVGVAHDPDLDGCAQGKTVAAVASGGKSQDEACPTTTTSVAEDERQPHDANQTTPRTSVSRGGRGQGNSSDGQGTPGGTQTRDTIHK
jgi:hypothetical protein